MSGTEPLTADDPRQLGGYSLTARLGQGGQGVVYLGHDDSDGSAVAVKTLHSDGIDAAGLRRQLADEIETARAVARFCTAQVLAADIDADPPYVVSEYIEGPTLREVVRRDGPMRGAALERLAVGTLTALAAIHQAGIVHRDFKPGNVLMGPGGPRVIDFGIARALEGTAILTSQIAGTPAYMAPEQIAGEALGPAVDLFSWGSTMVFAANGWGPFGQDSLRQVLHNVSNEPPDLGALEGRLRDIAARCLSKDPAQRPSAAETLMGVLGVAMTEPAAGGGQEAEAVEEPGSLPIHTLAAGAVAAAAPEARDRTAAEFRDSLPAEEAEAAAAEEGMFRSYPPTGPPPPSTGRGYAAGPAQAPAAPSGPQTPPGAGPQPSPPGPSTPPPAAMPPTGGQPSYAPPSGPQPPYGPNPGQPPAHSGPQSPYGPGPGQPPAPSGPQSPYGPGPGQPPAPSGPQPPYGPGPGQPPASSGQQQPYGPGPGAPSGPPPASSPYGPASAPPTGGQPSYAPLAGSPSPYPPGPNNPPPGPNNPPPGPNTPQPGPSAPPPGPQPPYGSAPGAPAPSGPQPSYGPAPGTPAAPGAPGAQPPSPYGAGAPPQQPGPAAGAPAKSAESGGGAGVIIGVVVGASILVVIAVVVIIVIILGG